MKKLLWLVLILPLCAFLQNPGPSITGATASSSSFTPTSVSGLIAWYSADCYTYSSGTCSTPSAGTLSTAWGDRSGNGYTGAVNGTCTFATSVINSLPAVSFDGSTCYFNFTNYPNSSNAYTAFVVMKNANTSSSGYMFGASLQGFAYWTCSSGKQQGVDAQNIYQMAIDNASCDTNWHQMNVTIQDNYGPYSFRINKSSDGSGTTPSVVFTGNTNAIGRNNYGDNGYLNGYIAEIFIYNNVVSSSNITSLEGYLYNKYGI